MPETRRHVELSPPHLEQMSSRRKEFAMPSQPIGFTNERIKICAKSCQCKEDDCQLPQAEAMIMMQL